MKKIPALLLIAVTLLPALLPAQKQEKTLWLHAGGHSGMLSLQYDIRLSGSVPQLGIMAGAGIIADPSATGFTIPASIYYLAGNKGRYF